MVNSPVDMVALQRERAANTSTMLRQRFRLYVREQRRWRYA